MALQIGAGQQVPIAVYVGTGGTDRGSPPDPVSSVTTTYDGVTARLDWTVDGALPSDFMDFVVGWRATWPPHTYTDDEGFSHSAGGGRTSRFFALNRRTQRGTGSVLRIVGLVTGQVATIVGIVWVRDTHGRLSPEVSHTITFTEPDTG